MVKGTDIHYYFICKTKLWLEHRRINMEFNSEDVLLGKEINNFTYKKEKKELIKNEHMAVDIVKFGDEIIVKEIKKSNKNMLAAKFQLLFYMYELKKMGLNIHRGFIAVPNMFKRYEVILDEKSESILKNIINDINKIIKGRVPKPERKPICRRCAYRDFCWG